MANPPHQAQQVILMPTPEDIGEPFSVGIAYYRTTEELAYHLRSLQQFSNGRLLVVLGIRGKDPVPSDYRTANVRLILTSDVVLAPEGDLGWVESDPFQAVVGAMAGLRQGEALILLFPADWTGSSPEFLIEQGRRWRATPHSPEGDEFFTIEDPN